jgi:hypothetical protein
LEPVREPLARKSHDDLFFRLCFFFALARWPLVTLDAAIPRGLDFPPPATDHLPFGLASSSQENE